MELMEKGLVKNWHNVKARGLKAVILRKLERMDEAVDWIRENLKLDSFDYVSLSELCYGAEEEERNQLQALLEGRMRGYGENYLQFVRDYAEAGFYEGAVQSLRHSKGGALISYYLQGGPKVRGFPFYEVRFQSFCRTGG